MGAEILVKLLWEWDPECITNRTARLCIKVGSHPEGWKLRQPRGSPYQSQENRTTGKCAPTEWLSYVLLDSLGKLVKKTRPTS